MKPTSASAPRLSRKADAGRQTWGVALTPAPSWPWARDEAQGQQLDARRPRRKRGAATKNRPGFTGPACAVSGARFPGSRGLGSPPSGTGRLYRSLASRSICCTPVPPSPSASSPTPILRDRRRSPSPAERRSPAETLSQIFHRLSTGATEFSSVALPVRHSMCGPCAMPSGTFARDDAQGRDSRRVRKGGEQAGL